MSGVLIQGTYLPGVGPTDRSSSTDETLLHLLAFFDYLPRVFLLAWTHWRSLFLPVLLDSCMSDTHFYFFQQVPHGGNKWGGVGEGDDTGWLIHLIWLMTMRTGAYNSNDKQTLLGPQDMTITHVRMREGCWALLLLSRIFFPPSPPAAPFQFKIHEIHTCAMKKKEENRTDDCTSNNLSVFFFSWVTLSKLQHICQRKRTHIDIPMIFVNYNFCLPGVKLLSTLTSTWTINHASTSKWVDF